LQLALATTSVQQGEIDRACEVAVEAPDLRSDQRIGPIDQRARTCSVSWRRGAPPRPWRAWLSGWRPDEHGGFFPGSDAAGGGFGCWGGPRPPPPPPPG